MRGKRRAVPWRIAGSLLWGALGLSACTLARPPVISRSHPEKIVHQASPHTLTELQVASEELDSARLALNAYEYESACRLAEQASTNAQVAEARAGTENSRWIAGDVRLSSEAVQAVATRLAVPSSPGCGPTSKE
jgi:hypothetical protein